MPEVAIEKESLRSQVSRVEQETRMVMPGIQALFGFQMIAVFNERFDKALSLWQKDLHLSAITFTVLAITLTMAPAAFHRQAEPQFISERLVKLANCWLTVGMFFLMLAISLDGYLVSDLILENSVLSSALAGALSLILLGFWYVFPIASRRHR